MLGHSYGGVAALEAAFLTRRISRLILYEPPLQDRIDLAVVEEMEKSIASGHREQALTAFLRRMVKLPAAVGRLQLANAITPFLLGTGEARATGRGE